MYSSKLLSTFSCLSWSSAPRRSYNNYFWWSIRTFLTKFKFHHSFDNVINFLLIDIVSIEVKNKVLIYLFHLLSIQLIFQENTLCKVNKLNLGWRWIVLNLILLNSIQRLFLCTLQINDLIWNDTKLLKWKSLNFSSRIPFTNPILLIFLNFLNFFLDNVNYNFIRD